MKKMLSDEQWKARDDARSLASAMDIVDDALRFKKAESAAKGMVKEIKEQAEEQQALGRNLEKVAKGNYSADFVKTHGKKEK